jgi:hypothetical protein
MMTLFNRVLEKRIILTDHGRVASGDHPLLITGPDRLRGSEGALMMAMTAGVASRGRGRQSRVRGPADGVRADPGLAADWGACASECIFFNVAQKIRPRLLKNKTPEISVDCTSGCINDSIWFPESAPEETSYGF